MAMPEDSMVSTLVTPQPANSDLLADFLQKVRVDLLIQETAYLQDTAGEHLSFFADFLFHQLHGKTSKIEIKKTNPPGYA